MKPVNRLLLILAGLGSAALAGEHQDWRLQLLKQEGLAPDAARLPDLEKGMVPVENRFLELRDLLGAEDFATRERSQKEILRMGIAAKPWLDRLEESEDPEVNMRINQIRSHLATQRRWSEAELLQYAVASLLREKNGEKPNPGAPLVFAELFQDKAADLNAPYRGFRFDASPGLTGKADDGLLKLSGRGPIEGDQRLVIPAKSICGNEVLPDRFRIEVMLGGTPGGESAYHIGVSVGKVRVLFHPGYDEGGFRFEQVDTHKALTQNANMGFTPATDGLATMGIGVKRLPNGDVEFGVTVLADQKEARRYTTRTTVSAAEIGKLDSISLDRSGRIGGDANFDNLVVEIPAP
jgi:hypothetical protein